MSLSTVEARPSIIKAGGHVQLPRTSALERQLYWILLVRCQFPAPPPPPQPPPPPPPHSDPS